MEEGSTIENRLEGPKLFEIINMSANDYIKQSPSESTNWFYSHLIENLKDGELKKAVDLARKEQLARQEAGIEISSRQKAIVQGAENYAFRAFKRKSNGEPLLYPSGVESTLENAHTTIHREGIEANNSYSQIFPNTIWEMFFIPTPADIETREVDTACLIVYENKPFVLTSTEGSKTTILVDISTADPKKQIREISLNEAHQHPTLRDIMIGTIEVHLNKGT
jgi:hypothetical protein